MPPKQSDIFLSYSRKDSEPALELAGRLRADGVSVWMDARDIGGAKQWAGEIASAIRECNCLLLLISENAAQSPNVLKEVALASEKDKRILPVVLRPTPIPVTLEYHLAGIHQINYDDYSSILQAIRDPSAAKQLSLPHDGRKSLLVLPFEDLSPAQDNGWFADGLTGELITALSGIRSLKVIDRNTSMDFKKWHGRTRDIARDFEVRYFLLGAVRMFEDQIKISVELLDIETGDYLWHDTHKGSFKDIFEIQESVARKVTEGLELTLSREEQRSIGDRGTKNAEAYELYLRGYDLYSLWTRQGMLDCLSVSKRIVEIDPLYAEAYLLRAMVLSNLYRVWDRNPKYLDEAETLYAKAREIRPNINLRDSLIIFLVMEHRYPEAEAIALEGVRDAPTDFYRHFILGWFNYNSGRVQEAIPAYKEALRLNPKYRMTYWNLTEALDRLGREEDRKHFSELALPHFERWLLLHPDDQFARAQYATFLLYAGHREQALTTLEPLLTASSVDGLALYTISVMCMHLGDSVAAIRTLDRAISSGFSHIELLKSDPNFAPLANSYDFQNLIARMNHEPL